MKKTLIEFYLDWKNNFLTISRMAEYYGLEVTTCDELVEIGRQLHKESIKQ